MADPKPTESEQEVLALQQELLAMMAEAVAAGLTAQQVAVKAKQITARRTRAVEEAVRRDIQAKFEGAVELEAKRAKKAAGGKSGAFSAGIDAATLTDTEYRAVRAVARNLLTGMTDSSVGIYRAALAQAERGVSLTGERAVKDAVRSMAEQGVYAFTYTRADGTLVRVPSDVAVRRVANNAGRRSQWAQRKAMAEANGYDLIEVPYSDNCRETHEVIDGGIFSLSGESEEYPPWLPEYDDLLEEPNCQHNPPLIYHPSLGRTYSDPYEGMDEEEKAERQRELTNQRRMQNDLRKAKRAAREVRNAGQDAREANAKARAAAGKLHAYEDEKGLRRQQYRERAY